MEGCAWSPARGHSGQLFHVGWFLFDVLQSRRSTTEVTRYHPWSQGIVAWLARAGSGSDATSPALAPSAGYACHTDRRQRRAEEVQGFDGAEEMIDGGVFAPATCALSPTPSAPLKKARRRGAYVLSVLPY